MLGESEVDVLYAGGSGMELGIAAYMWPWRTQTLHGDVRGVAPNLVTAVRSLKRHTLLVVASSGVPQGRIKGLRHADEMPEVLCKRSLSGAIMVPRPR